MNPDRRPQRSITTGSQQSGVQGPQRELQQGVRIGVTCIGCPNWSLSLKGLKNPDSTVGTDNTGGVLYLIKRVDKAYRVVPFGFSNDWTIILILPRNFPQHSFQCIWTVYSLY
jgi:hypothetical protein